jgi:hypothetical protein
MSDPISAATTFATLVGLICNYRQEKGEREQLTPRNSLSGLNIIGMKKLKT